MSRGSPERLAPSAHTYPLAQAPSAMRHFVAGKARGKLLVTP